jgi:hypothetical protein
LYMPLRASLSLCRFCTRGIYGLHMKIHGTSSCDVVSGGSRLRKVSTVSVSCQAYGTPAYGLCRRETSLVRVSCGLGRPVWYFCCCIQASTSNPSRRLLSAATVSSSPNSSGELECQNGHCQLCILKHTIEVGFVRIHAGMRFASWGRMGDLDYSSSSGGKTIGK